MRIVMKFHLFEKPFIGYPFGMNIVILIPVYNEETVIRQVVAEVLPVAHKYATKVLFVIDCSTD